MVRGHAGGFRGTRDETEMTALREVVQMLQAACPNTWQRVLRNRLGSGDPANLTAVELAEFTEHVFWVVKQNGIRDPAGLLAYQVQLEAKAAGKLASSVKIGDIPVQSKSAGRGPVTFELWTITMRWLWGQRLEVPSNRRQP